METVLVGYENTEAGGRALTRAAELAKACNATLVVVSVGKPEPLKSVEAARESALLRAPAGPVMRMPDVAPWIPSPAEPPPAPEVAAREQLQQARAQLGRREIEVEYVAEVGDPAGRLLAVADERNADLIVVGSHHHGFLDRLLGGGVEDKLERKTHRDLLIVH